MNGIDYMVDEILQPDCGDSSVGRRYAVAMTFNEGARLDPSQAEDRRGRERDGPRRQSGPGPRRRHRGADWRPAGHQPGPALRPCWATPAASLPLSKAAASGLESCQTGQDANERLDCRILGTANSLNSFWPGYLDQYGVKYSVPKTVIFTGSVSTACGQATSAVGPFYCPGDNKAYFDPDFFAQLETQFGSSGGPLAQEYVVAHEFGHHVQNLTGTIGKAQQGATGAQSAAVRTELQADCYAGIWMRYASSQPAPGSGQPFLKAADAEGPQRRPVRGIVCGRRQDPAGRHGPHQPRVLEPRLQRATPKVALHRLPKRRPGKPATPSPSRRSSRQRKNRRRRQDSGGSFV